MSVFKAAIVPRLETPPVISAMINASRYAISSFSIEMRSIQVGVAYRPHHTRRKQIRIRDNQQRVKAYSTYSAELGMKDKMTGTNALIDNKVFR